MYRLLFLVLLALGACGEQAATEEVGDNDSTEGPEIIIINEPDKTADMSDDFSSKDNYKADSASPIGTEDAESLAERMAPHAIGLVYIETPLRTSTKVLSQSTASDGRKELQVNYRWYDRWSSRPYEMKGRLLVGADGTDADFKVLSRNAELEAYSMIEEKTGTQKHVDQL